MARRRRYTPKSLASGVAVALLALLFARLGLDDAVPGAFEGAAPRGPSPSQLFEERASGVMVEGSGRVEVVLSDDRKGSQHQRFLLETEPGFTILVSHNIDLAPRVAGIARGDTVAFRGQYEWNEKGGVVHWTHHDPGGRRPGGWLEHEGRTYR